MPMNLGCRLPVLAAAIAVVLAGPAPARAGETVDVVERITDQTLTDMGPEGASVGDNITFANRLYDKDDKTLLGHDDGWCIRTNAQDTWECFRSLTLEQGQITLEGPFYNNRDSIFAVTGGTGAYLAAQGECKMHARDPQRKAFDISCSLIY
jgi:hypothetical protein